MNFHDIPRSEFLSPKCARAIPFGGRHERDALRWATLEKTIDVIDYDTITRTTTDGRLEFVVVDERRVLDVIHDTVDGGTRRELVAVWRKFGFETMTITSEQIETEPRFENTRHIWDLAVTHTPLAFRLRLCDLLDEQPMSLGDLLPLLRCERDPLPIIFGLACRAEIDIDLDAPIGTDTLVRLR